MWERSKTGQDEARLMLLFCLFSALVPERGFRRSSSSGSESSSDSEDLSESTMTDLEAGSKRVSFRARWYPLDKCTSSGTKKKTGDQNRLNVYTWPVLDVGNPHSSSRPWALEW